MGFPPGKKIIVRADAVICRISNVDITAKSCSLTFHGKTASIAGRPAHELYTTLVKIGVASLGATGWMIAGVKNLECTIDPAQVSQEGGAARTARSPATCEARGAPASSRSGSSLRVAIRMARDHLAGDTSASSAAPSRASSAVSMNVSARPGPSGRMIAIPW
jgi:hypothetical protein